MKTYTYDFHIHTALSPCGEEDMTPHNIVGMAQIMELDMIAVTDHNTIGNAAAVAEAAKHTGITVICGMELETAEEAHFICLFPNLESACAFDRVLAPFRPHIPNRPEIFGSQFYFDGQDRMTRTEPELLVAPLTCSVYDAVPWINAVGGVIYPAHVDRASYSILSNLGAIPQDLGFSAAEISRSVSAKEAYSRWAELEVLHLLTGSDAHRPEDFLPEPPKISLKEKTPQCVIDYLKTKKAKG